MTLADKMTTARLVLAPVFFGIFFFPRFLPFFGVTANDYGIGWTVPVLWIIFVVAEITDFLDGMIARKRGEVSDFGKLFDPFADTLTQVTFFLCFVVDGILPPFLFLVVLYREFGILFIRNLMLKKGISLGARISGKLKTVTYILAAALALLASSVSRLDLLPQLYPWLILAAKAAFALSVIIAVLSFFDYLMILRKNTEKL